jgi:hypothetical protein
MPRLLSVLLISLVPFSASAECASRTLLRTGAAICSAQVDRGVLYFSLCDTRQIQRLDEATGQVSTIFTADSALGGWVIDDGHLAVMPRASTSPVSLSIISPDGASRIVAESAPDVFGSQVRDITTSGGYLYWIQASTFDGVAKVYRTNGQIRRTALRDGAVETIASGLSTDFSFRYAVSGDRLVFRTVQGVFVQPASGGVAALLLPRKEVDSIAGLTDDAVFVTTWRRDLSGTYVQLLRVPWVGGPVETLYETSYGGERSFVSITGALGGATTYIARNASKSPDPSVSTSLVVLRDGAATVRYSTGGPLSFLAAEEGSVIIAEQRSAFFGMHAVERICGAVAPRMRAIR